MRLSPWLAPLTDSRSRLADKVVRRKVTRRRKFNRLSQMTERLEARTLLTSFTVDSFFDTVDDNPGDSFAADATGRTSLRAAIMEANASAGSDTITLGSGIFNLSIEGTDEDSAFTGDLDITDNLTIQGQSAQITIIDARTIDRIFDVMPGVSLQLFNVTITGGNLSGRGDGGGIRVDNGMLQLNDVVVTGNQASNGGGLQNNQGLVFVTNSTFSENRAEGNVGFAEGGAINSFGGTVIVRQSTISNNFAQTVGGGISAGADTFGGTLSIENSTIAQNHAGEMQGGNGEGGGISIQANVNATLLASTIAYNSAGNQGAGIWTNGSLTLERTIVSNNFGTPDDGPEGFISGGTVTSNGFNLVREDTDFNFTPATVDLIGVFASPIDPNLQGLADNGGPTQTIALGGMSPAIDAGPSIASPLFADQRGFARERDGDRNGSVITDIGAFEVQSPFDVFVDDIGSGVIIGGFAGDFQVIIDGDGVTGGGGGTPNGILDFGDMVTFSPGGQPVFNLEFGVRAFGTINDALTAIRFDSDFLTEVVLGSGTYTENLTLDFSGLTLRGHTGIATDVVIDGGGAATAISVVEDSVSLESLRVTNATTGVEVAPFSSAQFFDAKNIQVDGTTNGLTIFDSIGFMDVSIENSVFTGNTGDGINITNVGTAMLRNISSTFNGQDGVEIVDSTIVAFDTVTVGQNSGRGLVVDGAGTIAVMNPRTSASANGNVFSNSSTILFNGVTGPVPNSTTVTATEIQFDAGAGATQENITLTNVTSLFVTGDEGNDTLTVDYSAGSPSPSRQLFLDGGEGRDTIHSIADTNHRVTEARLTIGGIDDVAITSFEQASLTGGAGSNNLDARGFYGQTTLSGLGGNDTLRGSVGDDVLDGGADDDILQSGPTHEQYIVGGTTFENLNLSDSDTGVMTILDETDTETATILLDSDFFRFNDVSYAGDVLFVAPSGAVSFGGPIFPQDNFDLNKAPNPSIGILAPLFDDWVTGITSPPGLTLPDAKVLYKFEDTNADFINDRLIIEWNDVFHRDQIDTLSTPMLKAGASPVTFQLILELNTFDRDGDIIFNYVDLDTGAPFSAIANGASATVGGKDAGENPSGVEQVSFNSLNSLIGSGQAIVARSGKSDGDDILIGGVGDDTLYSSSGLDSVDGGAGSNDRLIFDGLKNDLASDHTINNAAVDSTIFPGLGRSYDFKTSYSNIEALDVSFGPADQNVLVELSGLPAEVSLDTRGPSASDKVTINGTAGNDALILSGETLTNGTTTLSLAGIEQLTLEISSGGADAISVDQNFTGSARTVIVSGDSADDLVSLQSTTKPQQVNIFNGNAYIAQVEELLGGNLILEEILSDGGDDGSENMIENQQAPDQVIVSPDGTRVYVAASDSDSLVVYNRDRVTGDLTFVESLVNLGTDFLTNPISGLDGASNVIVSSDGRYVYVASEVDQTIAFFVHHEGDNQLTFITSTVLDTAGNSVSIPLPSDMAFIPDGSVLLVTSEAGNRIDFFEVSVNGDLTFQASLVDGGRDSGTSTIDGIGGASSVALSPDGRFMYVTGATDNAIAVFSQPDDSSEMFGFGLPLFVQKLANGDMDGALNLVSGLGGASSVEISPDGRHVYVTGETDNSVAVFSRDLDTGELTFVEKLDDLGLDSMSNTVENLSAPVSVSISPNGTVAYVAASGSNAVTLFARDIFTGVLTFLETLAAGDTDGAGTTIAGVNGVSNVFASVDGQHVYVSGTGDDSIVRFNVPRLLDVSTDGFAPISVATSGANDLISLSLDGQPAMVTIDAGGDGNDNDLVIIQGTSADDTVDVNGESVTSGSTTFSVTNTESLSLFLDDGDDTVNVTASSSGPESFFVDGGNQTGSDVLNIDAQTAQVADIDSSFSFSDGQQSVSFSDFETVAITNATPTINDDTFAIAENSPVSTSVGTPFASDPEFGESLTWRIVSGNTGNAFAINSATGEITVNAALNFEILSTYSLVVEVEDNQSLTDQATITINVTDVKPVIGDQSFEVFESQLNGSAVGTVMLEPGDMNSVIFSIAGGNTGGAFAIDSFSGLISVADTDAIIFGGPPFLLTIEVTDDGGETFDSGVITVDVLEMPPAGAVFDDAIDSGGGTLVGPFASLDNGPGDGSVSIPSIDAYGQFFIAVYDPIDDAPAGTTFDSEVYFRFGNSGVRQSLIDASGGSGSSIRSLNDEANSSFNIGDLTFVLTQILEPVFDEFGSQSGTLLTQTYRIMNTGVSSQAFELVRYLDGDLEFDGSIDEGGGRLQLPTGEDLLFETDLGTSPETSTKFLGITGFGGTVPEVGRFQIEEFSVLQSAIVNGDLLTDDLSNFGNAVDGNGDQFVDEGLEFDLSLSLANLFVLGASQSATYTTHTLFGSDSPSNATGNTAPTIDTQSFSVDENSAAETFIGTVLADDLETPSNLTFAITGGDPDGFFSIDSSTGDIVVANSGLDHEMSPAFNLTIQVTDPGSLSASATVTINIDDLNEAPILDAIGDRTAIVDEELSFTATATDPDSPPATLTFTLGEGAPVGASITTGGEFTFTPTADDDGMSFSVTIIVTEGNAGALSASETITISVSSVALDFGDAPDSYKTTLANDGPRHVIGSLFLGSAVDPEVDGQPDPAALGDDNNSSGQGSFIDDEGGITFLSALTVGATREFRVNASQAGFLDAWIDFDHSGTFTSSENLSAFSNLVVEGGSSSGSFEGGGGAVSGSFNIGTGIAVPAGFSTVSFNIPNTTLPGPTFARFRLSSTGGLSPTGLASDGEVEDYLVNVVAPPVGNSDSIEPALTIAVDGFFDAFPDELNDPDPNITGNELPLAVQAEGGSRAERRDGAPPLNQTDPALRIVIQAINDAVNRLEQNRGPDENILVLATHPVDFLLTDTQGRTVGFTQAGGTVNEIGANATFSGDGVVELLTIRNADPGEYGLQLVGVGGVFRGGSSLITPSGTQRITFQGSLAQNAGVQLALTYQEGFSSFPTRKDLDSVNFSEIADLVAQIPSSDDDARTLAAGATEALASIALDRLDASLFSKKDGDEAALQALIERISEARKKLLDAIETSLDDDELEKLKRVLGDDAKDADSVEALARVLLETLSGPLISAPRQVKDLSSTLQQLLDQLQEQRQNQQKQQDNQQPAKAAEPKGAAKPETEDKRTSQRTRTKPSAPFLPASFVVSTEAVATRRRATTTSETRQAEAPKLVGKQQPSDPEPRPENHSTVSSERANSEGNSDQVDE
jgi:6-phosphogluconolactonase (cycloisomerase 2 family)